MLYSPHMAPGVIYILIVAAFWGMFPILVNQGSQHIQPLFFAATSMLLGAITAFITTLLKGNFRNILNKKAFLWGCGVAFTMAAFPYALLFIGSKMTSGINTAALMLSEIIFTLIITPFFGEKPTFYKTFGGLLVLIGAFTILFKCGSFNIGDLLIILSTMLLPVGNYFGKKALRIIVPENLMIIRYTLAGAALLFMSLFFENKDKMIPSLLAFWPYVALNGILLFGFVNNLWYHGLKKLQISKAVFLLMTYPIFSLIFLVLFFNEKPNFFQIIGVLIIILGAYFTGKKP